MRVMVFVKATEDSEKGMKPSPELSRMFVDMGRFNEAQVKAGILVAGDGLRPSSHGKRIAFDGPDRTVIDGPFAETRELVAGYWLWQVSTMDEAVEWVKRCPNPMFGPSEIEIRPLYEAEDFADLIPAEASKIHDGVGKRLAER
ncbi:YciI family protein [Sphingomonas sp. CFBP 13714]|nr:YciI family protein [Sphingomonas sp. CFBP 13714]